MELKVWVDGIQRVVCGATLDTTCQDVVVALAHAMGRTGRFTLIEKWRDIDRPLTPAECPLRVLHKWGEYAPQVKFLLCQADLDQKQQPSKEKTPAFVENRPFFTPKSLTLYGPASDVSVKRALTFSGVHGTSASHSSLQSNALAPTTKLRRTHLGPVPISSDKHSSSLLQSSTHSSPRHPALLGKGSHEQHKEPSPPKQAQRHPVAPPRKRLSPVLQEQNARMVPHDSLDSLPLSSSSSSSTLQNSGNSRVQSSSSESSQQCQSSESNSPVNSFRQSHVHSSSGLQSQGVQHSHGYPPDLKQVEERLNQSSPSPPLLPSSLPPSVTGSDLSSYPKPLPLRPPDLMQDHKKSMIDIETSVTGRDHSHQASLEIEEYDLDSNFPDTYKDFGGNEWPAVTVEYRLEDGLGPGGSHVENEHAKLVRLVDMQQERMKTQESQIDLINTEITSLEDREREYEENLQDILVELLQLENVERDLEPELSRLENVEWDNVLDGEKKCEQDLKCQIADCQAQIDVYQEKIEQLQQRERDLTEETEAEKVRIQHEEDILKAEEARAQEEADKLGIEVDSLQGQLQELNKTAGEREVVLRELDIAMKSAEIDLQERQCQLLELEQELKEENLKALSSNPSKDDLQRQESGETILKILEGRLSPRLPAASGPMPDNATLPPFISALAPKNPSGVWV